MKKLATLILAAALVCNAATALAKPHEPTNIMCGLSQKEVENICTALFVFAMQHSADLMTADSEKQKLWTTPSTIENFIKNMLVKCTEEPRKKHGLPEWKEK